MILSTLFHLRLLCFLLLMASQSLNAFAENYEINPPLKALHLTFHKGCAKEINGIAKVFGLDLETWFIPDFLKSFDGTSSGNALYNIGHDRAERIWNLHKEEFAKFDLIITSDTAPLSRIFLQNGWQKPLVIWICNRFDYYDGSSLDCDFPDKEYYELFGKASQMPNVAVIAYTPFEHYYAKTKGVDTGDLIITPCAPALEATLAASLIPSQVVRADSFFLPPYHNETRFMDLSAFCKGLGIPNYCGRYGGPMDLMGFKGIIHLPYTWSSLAFFENIMNGLPYFVPSRSFFKKLAKQKNYFHPNLPCLVDDNLFDLSEWYIPGREEIITYFDSWEDLQYKTNSIDYAAMRLKIQAYAQQLKAKMINRWHLVFQRLAFLRDSPNDP